MGNSYSGIPKEWDLLKDRRFVNHPQSTPHIKDGVAKRGVFEKRQTVLKIAALLGEKVPDYFYVPEHPRSLPRPAHPSAPEAPGTSLPYHPPLYAPPAPSLAHFHPAADAMRRFLFLHIYSGRFENAPIGKDKLFAPGPIGEGEGKMKIAYIHVIKDIRSVHRITDSEDRLSEIIPGSCINNCDKIEILEMIPNIDKIRMMFTTSLSITERNSPPKPGFISPTVTYYRTKTLRLEMTPLDFHNRLIKEPGTIGMEIRLSEECEKEMRWLHKDKDWAWFVQIWREVMGKIIGPDGGVWGFFDHKCEGMEVVIPDEGLLSCYIVRNGGV